MELKEIKGLSDKRISDLNKLGICSAENLIKHFPKNYIDLTKVTPIRFAYHNECVLTVARVELEPQISGGRVKYVKTYCTQGEDTFSVIWFNQPYVASKLKRDKEYVFYGRVTNKFGMISMTNPVFEEVDKNYKLKGIVPVYSIKGNITQSVMKSSILNAIKLVEPKSVIPYNLQQKYALSSLQKAYYDVHNPPNEKAKQLASDRIAVEEYFSLISAFRVIKGDKKNVRVNKYTCSAKQLKEFSLRFGFDFTDGQKSAVNEIFSDLTGHNVMNRLLQGDVGSGKTAVSACAIYMSAVSGHQTAVLSPTEVLAKQNYEVIKKYLPEFNVVFLSGSMSAKEKKEVKNKLITGEAQIAVGTHALIEDDVEFKDLTLCVCDEQQRFGVGQRSALKGKGKSTDILVMSATPIPRTLSLIFYGDLDVSTIPDKPVSRAEIKTSIVPSKKYQDMLAFIDKQFESGKQGYFVCPKIDGDEEGTVMSVTELYDELKNLLPNRNIALLHGKMKDKEKTAVMQDFKNKKYDAIVSTTVIEVGVDVANASVMVIYNAERFGLSQLHQLRGRVGRSDILSYCFLLMGNDTEKARERLNAIKSTSDGFKISELDYDMRGSGDFLGERQSGKFISELGALKYSSSVIFFAKALSDEAFANEENHSLLNKMAKERYYQLKDVTLN